MHNFSTTIGEDRRTTGEERKLQEYNDVPAVPPWHPPRGRWLWKHLERLSILYTISKEHLMEKSTAIQDFLLITNLPSRTLLIANVTPGASFKRSTDFFEDLKTLIGYRKRHTSTKIDYVQMDLCEFKTYGNYLGPYWSTQVSGYQLDARMLYAIPYNHLAAIPVGILLVYIILFIVRVFSKYATLFWTEGT